jgi:hypothetical protein
MFKGRFEGRKDQVLFALFGALFLSSVILKLFTPLLIGSLIAFFIWEGRVAHASKIRWCGAATLLALVALFEGIFSGTFTSLTSVLLFGAGIIGSNTGALVIALSEPDSARDLEIALGERDAEGRDAQGEETIGN